MKRDEALKIIAEEGLNDFNLCEQRSHRENEVGIKEIQGKWIVYATDERASIVTGSEGIFEFENDAWDNFVKRLRAGKLLQQLSGGKYY